MRLVHLLICARLIFKIIRPCSTGRTTCIRGFLIFHVWRFRKPGMSHAIRHGNHNHAESSTTFARLVLALSAVPTVTTRMLLALRRSMNLVSSVTTAAPISFACCSISRHSGMLCRQTWNADGRGVFKPRILLSCVFCGARMEIGSSTTRFTGLCTQDALES